MYHRFSEKVRRILIQLSVEGAPKTRADNRALREAQRDEKLARREREREKRPNEGSKKLVLRACCTTTCGSQKLA